MRWFKFSMVAIVVLGIGTFVYGIVMTNIDEQTPGRAATMVMGYAQYEFVDASGANVTPTMLNCRGILADSSGIVKIAYTDDWGTPYVEVKNLVGGIICPVRNVNTVYRYYTGSTAGTVKSWSSAGSATTNAIKLLR